ncbi:MAG TPA: FtsX-like permease family protein [Daejeonella sp.]|nr:FtsX-like permease family protein [Daejeonella sp.]
MNLPFFIARRITLNSKRTFSKLIVRIAILGIMLGLAVMILAVAIVKGFKSEIREKVRGFAGDIQIVKYDLNASYENSPFSMNLDTLKQIGKYPEIAYMQPFATKPGIINVNNEVEGVVLKGVDKGYHWNYLKNILVAGRTLDFSDSLKSQREIMISSYTAERLNLKVGDDFLMYFVQQPLRKRKFEIVGIFNLGIEDLDKMYVIGDLSLIRRLNNWSVGEVGGYELRLKNFKQLDSTAVKVYENLNIHLKSYTVQEYYPTIFEWLALLDVNTQVILVLMLAVAIINMISALLIMILERTNMIGILKALGSTNWSIRKIFLYNAAYLIGLGLIFGNLLGVGIGIFQANTHFFQLDQASYFISFVPIQLEFKDVLLLNAGTLLICVLVLLIPSMLVSRISPVKAITFK